MQYKDNQFVTLTYSDPELPLNNAGSLRLKSVTDLSWKDYVTVGANASAATLAPRDLQLYLKRQRLQTAPIKMRFFAVGEYGDATFRPHFHFGAFNFPPCARGQTKTSPVSQRRLWRECCSTCYMVGTVWGHGDIEVRALDAGKCEYLARYVTKKMTAKEDARLLGRHPEFSRQSRRPGVGFPSVAKMARDIRVHIDPSELVDVPGAVKQGRGHLPLGRYMRNKLRLALGLPEGAPDAVLHEAWCEQVLPVLKMAQANNENPSLRAAFAAVNAGYEASLRAKMDLKGKGKI